MALTELIIIYLACGCPVGVYYVTRGGRGNSLSDLAAVAAHFAFWPIFAAALCMAWFSGSNEAAASDLDSAVGSIRNRIESIAYDNRSTPAVFEFREVFARFTGLTMALKFNEKGMLPEGVRGLLDRENVLAASACLDRRNRQRIVFHQVQSRNEFVSLISGIAQSHPNGDQIVESGMTLARLLDDEEAIDDLSLLIPEPAKALTASSPAKISQAQKT
jgi:hypothetical protein